MTKIKLKKLNLTHSNNILNYNTGNVREYFIPFRNVQEVNIWVEENIQKEKLGLKQEYVIENIDTDEFIGMIALDGFKENISEVRLWIKTDSQRKGMAKQAMLHLLNIYPNTKISYIADKDNIGSNKLALSCNFKFINEFDDEGIPVNKYHNF